MINTKSLLVIIAIVFLVFIVYNPQSSLSIIESYTQIGSGDPRKAVFLQENGDFIQGSITNLMQFPVGCIVPWVTITIPGGWLLCDGSAIPSGTEYTHLRNILSDSKLAPFIPNGKVPDLRDRVPMGRTTDQAYGLSGSSYVHIYGHHIPTHTHDIAYVSSTSTVANGSQGKFQALNNAVVPRNMDWKFNDNDGLLDRRGKNPPNISYGHNNTTFTTGVTDQVINLRQNAKLVKYIIKY